MLGATISQDFQPRNRLIPESSQMLGPAIATKGANRRKSLSPPSEGEYGQEIKKGKAVREEAKLIK
jgi:hypothetical protein